LKTLLHKKRCDVPHYDTVYLKVSQMLSEDGKCVVIQVVCDLYAFKEKAKSDAATGPVVSTEGLQCCIKPHVRHFEMEVIHMACALVAYEPLNCGGGDASQLDIFDVRVICRIPHYMSMAKEQQYMCIRETLMPTIEKAIDAGYRRLHMQFDAAPEFSAHSLSFACHMFFSREKKQPVVPPKSAYEDEQADLVLASEEEEEEDVATPSVACITGKDLTNLRIERYDRYAMKRMRERYMYRSVVIVMRSIDRDILDVLTARWISREFNCEEMPGLAADTFRIRVSW